MTKAGYRVKIWSQDEKKANDTDSLNKAITALNLMPGNPKLMEVIQRKALEIADLKPEEVTEIMQFEEQKAMMMVNNPMLGMQQLGMPGQPQQPLQPQINPQQLIGGNQLA